MPSRLTRAAAAIAVAATAATGIAADAPETAGFTDEETGLFFAEQEAFYAPGPSGIGNLDSASGTHVSWTPELAGTTGYTGMNNYSSVFGVGRYENTFTAEGTFVGHLDTIAVELFSKTFADALCQLDALAWDLRIDGETILFTAGDQPSAGLQIVPVGDLWQTRFVFTGIHEQMDELDLVGDDTTEHTVFMNFANYYACTEAYVVYGSDEAPSRLVTNVQPQGRRGRWVNYTEVPVTDPPPPLS